MSDSKTRTARAPKTWEAFVILLLVVGILVTLIIGFGDGPQMPMFLALLLSFAYALYLGYSAAEVEGMMFDQLRSGMAAVLINILIGLLIAGFIISGIVPYMIYLGLFVITPKFFLVSTLLLCSVLSWSCGSSWTTVGTIGIAMVGIGMALQIPVEMTAAAVITGAMFGDKNSPLSDTTICAAASAGTPLYQHVHSELFTTLPAVALSAIAYLFMGFKYGAHAADAETITAFQNALSGTFWFNPVLLLPILLLAILIIKKVSAILSMSIVIIITMLFALFAQGIPFTELSTSLIYGWSHADTGVESINALLSKGGMDSMWYTISIILLGMSVAGILSRTKTLVTALNAIKFASRSVGNLVVSTLICEFGLMATTGTSYIPEMMTSATFGSTYDKMDIHRKVMSRCTEDVGTVAVPMIPWSSTAVYFSGLLGVATLHYVPYYFFGFITPVIAIIYAYTGFGIWHSDGERAWGRNKKANKLADDIAS